MILVLSQCPIFVLLFFLCLFLYYLFLYKSPYFHFFLCSEKTSLRMRALRVLRFEVPKCSPSDHGGQALLVSRQLHNDLRFCSP